MKTLDEMISIMQAAAAGKEIECRFVTSQLEGLWHQCTSTTRMWDWFGCDYRVKPVEPRRVLVAYSKHGEPRPSTVYHPEIEKKYADNAASNGFTLAEFIELTPELRKALNL